MFRKFEFDQNKMGLNIKAMDDEHKQLIDIMNELGEKNEQKVSKDELRKVFQKLEKFTVEHFQHEEEFFSGLENYDQEKIHKQIHKTLLNRLNDHKLDFENSPSEQLSHDFFIFLKTWLSAHICGIDIKYGQAAGKKSA